MESEGNFNTMLVLQNSVSCTPVFLEASWYDTYSPDAIRLRALFIRSSYLGSFDFRSLCRVVAFLAMDRDRGRMHTTLEQTRLGTL